MWRYQNLLLCIIRETIEKWQIRIKIKIDYSLSIDLDNIDHIGKKKEILKALTNELDKNFSGIRLLRWCGSLLGVMIRLASDKSCRGFW